MNIGTVALDAGSASFTVPALSTGTHTIVASYSGDAQKAATTQTFVQEVKVAQAMKSSPVPTMSDYALWLLGAALMWFGMRRLKN